MSGNVSFASSSGNKDLADPFAEAGERLFPPLRQRLLVEAASSLAQGHIDAAEQLVSKYLTQHPRDPSAVNLLADIARRKGRFEKAAELLSKCLERAPDCAGYKFNYAVVLRRLDRFKEALAQLDALLSGDPSNPLYRDQKAKVLRGMGRHKDALAYRRALVEDYPRSADLWLHYATSLRSVGSHDECVAAYHKVLELAPNSSAVAYSRLADLKTYRFTAGETEHMEQQLRRAELPPGDRADLHFALGKAYGDQKLYPKSFENYAKGNALRRLNVDFDPERLTAYRLNCESIFTGSFMSERAGVGLTAADPIFIVGLPRSGSTLVEQILSSHSAIEGLEELPDLDVVVGKRLASLEGGEPHQFWIGGWFEFRNGLVQALPRALASFSAEDFRSLGQEYLELTRSRRKLGRPFFTDKALRNFGYAGLIHLILPHAKIVDVRRHPLDCGWSCFSSDFPGGQPFANRLHDIGRHYLNYTLLMAHFDRVLPGRIHRVFYERLIENPEAEVRRLLDYLGLPFEDSCLRFHEQRREVNTLSSEQVRQPLYKTGMGQSRPYEPWLGPLKSALGPALEGYSQMQGGTEFASGETADA